MVRPPAPTDREVMENLDYETMWAPLAGPVHPFRDPTAMLNSDKNVHTGFVQNFHMSAAAFEDQYRAFHVTGRAYDPASRLDQDMLQGEKPASLVRYGRKRKAGSDDPSSTEYLGPWAPFDTDADKTDLPEPTAEQIELAKKTARERKEKKDSRPVPQEDQPPETGDEPHSVFHGKTLTDYQGRAWCTPPSDNKGEPADEAFLPKNCIHTWTGHTKGVSAIRFFPRFGHLLLSASMDTKIKIWDVHNNRRCMQTYHGHSKAVRDICFSNDGKKFLSSGYDKMIRQWDTETGQCVKSFTTGKTSYCVKYHAADHHQHIFMVGSQDKKVYQFDERSGKIVQVYNEHLGPVNTVTFVDNNRRFVSSSDDKKMFVWEFGIPVVIKHIAEPHMHSMPSITLTPTGEHIACQSLDNQILLYEASGRFRLNKRKAFRGHVIAGYACQVGFSPEGSVVMSGDSDGRIWFWDYQTCRITKTLKAHDGVAIGCAWNPVEKSRVATCGWDGLIKYWD
eukprot:TRINITY_DN5228_c1_g1_i4.p1 TRINITY_DN5228_c1_g1~~TRINITY_DN5228_c1_g1_i4.p1  ORF type:complete len:506 (+),score=74.36 TRINITY_DN5228_c1_g1_i4:1742-3259(+)